MRREVDVIMDKKYKGVFEHCELSELDDASTGLHDVFNPLPLINPIGFKLTVDGKVVMFIVLVEMIGKKGLYVKNLTFAGKSLSRMFLKAVMEDISLLGIYTIYAAGAVSTLEEMGFSKLANRPSEQLTHGFFINFGDKVKNRLKLIGNKKWWG